MNLEGDHIWKVRNFNAFVCTCDKTLSNLANVAFHTGKKTEVCTAWTYEYFWEGQWPQKISELVWNMNILMVKWGNYWTFYINHSGCFSCCAFGPSTTSEPAIVLICSNSSHVIRQKHSLLCIMAANTCNSNSITCYKWTPAPWEVSRANTSMNSFQVADTQTSHKLCQTWQMCVSYTCSRYVWEHSCMSI